MINHGFLRMSPIQNYKTIVQQSQEDAVEAFKNNVLEMSQSEWKKCFDMWIAGEYFEKQFNHFYTYSHFYTLLIEGILVLPIRVGRIEILI